MKYKITGTNCVKMGLCGQLQPYFAATFSVSFSVLPENPSLWIPNHHSFSTIHNRAMLCIYFSFSVCHFLPGVHLHWCCLLFSWFQDEITGIQHLGTRWSSSKVLEKEGLLEFLWRFLSEPHCLSTDAIPSSSSQVLKHLD